LVNRHRAAAVVPGARGRVWPRFAADDRLVALVRRGDLTAFEILYDRHARELLVFCSYILDSKHDAEDAVQSTFASAYRALMADERRVDLRPWLFSIARNASLSILRKRRPTTEIHEAAVAGEDPAVQAEQRENLRQVVATMLDLPERQRTALVLAELHGLSHGEIGTVLGIPAERVKSYIYQARSSLISERVARSVDCAEIRMELSTARGAALLKGKLRRHLRSCEGCRDYAAELSRQRGQLGILLPLAPTLALKRRVLDAAAGNAPGAGTCMGGATVGASVAGTTAELAGTGAKALVAKLLIGVAGVGVGTGAGTLALSTAATSPPRSVTRLRLAADAAALHGLATRDTSANAAVSLRAGGAGDAKQTGQRPATDRPTRSSRTASAAGAGHGKGAQMQSSGAGPGKSAEAHGNGLGRGNSEEAKGKSSEAHGSATAHGKSAEAHGNGTAHGSSGQAHGNGNGNGASHGQSGQAHGNGPSSAAGSPAVHPNGEGAGGHGVAPGNGNTAGSANANSPTTGNPPGQSAGGHGEGASPPGAPGPSAGSAGGSSHGQGEQGASAGGAHEAPSGHPQKP
jgi:RNA polymerase sigma factor (sigma-70 family)